MSGTRDEQYGNRNTLSWDLNERSRMSFGAGWERYKRSALDRRDDVWYVSIGASHQISKKLNSEVQYQRSARTSTVDFSGYAENRISAYIHATF